MHTIFLSKNEELYLQKYAIQSVDGGITYGLVIGQHAKPGEIIAVHLAKNGEEEDVYTPALDDLNVSGSEASSHVVRNSLDLTGVDIQTFSRQWISASKMTPGSFEVMGIFISGASQKILRDSTFKAGKRLLYEIHNMLRKVQPISGCDLISHFRYIFLAYSFKANQAICKLYTYSEAGGTFSPMEYQFVEKGFEWQAFECNYEMDEVFPIIGPTHKINIEQQLLYTIEAVRKSLVCSEIFIQDEAVNDETTVESYIQSRTSKKRRSQQEIKTLTYNELLHASVYLPLKCCIANSHNGVKVRQFNGVTRFEGLVSSRVWCSPQTLLGDVKRFIRDDILRSLAARFKIYCDGLTEPDVSNEAIITSEPPRRVYFNLPMGDNEYSPVQFSEYIFQGEAGSVAVAQAKQILDIDIDSENIISDLEGLPEDEDFSDNNSSESLLNRSVMKTMGSGRDLTRTMYMLGISVSLLVLFLSALVHFFLKG